ncbi:A24 family peptidase [Providencia rettgeri]|uniref:prepilin peptidase n=1 Tax=Providencia rettgeri TaxID=587 RepID=UPI0034E0D1CB
MEQFIHHFYSILAMIIGCCIGSFINVVIYRLPIMIFTRGEAETLSLSFPSSHCPVCESKVYKRDNIPVLSWLLLKGQCRHCGCSIPKIYPISELVFGLVFGLFFFCYSSDKEISTLFVFLGIFTVCYAIIFIDLKWFIIPDELNYFLIWLGLLSAVMKWTSVSPLQAVLGCIMIWMLIKCIMILFQRMTGKEGIGDGDAKLFAAGATFVGISQLHWLILFSSLIGGGIYLAMRYYHYKPDRGEYAIYYDIDDKYHVPFGPAICISIMLLYLYQQIIY